MHHSAHITVYTANTYIQSADCSFSPGTIPHNQCTTPRTFALFDPARNIRHIAKKYNQYRIIDVQTW